MKNHSKNWSNLQDYFELLKNQYLTFGLTIVSIKTYIIFEKRFLRHPYNIQKRKDMHPNNLLIKLSFCDKEV